MVYNYHTTKQSIAQSTGGVADGDERAAQAGGVAVSRPADSAAPLCPQGVSPSVRCAYVLPVCRESSSTRW
jgi:hypothetical protein